MSYQEYAAASVAGAQQGAIGGRGGPDAVPDADAIAAEQNAHLEKYNKLSAVVQANPDEFDTWTALIQTAEKLNGIERIRTVFDGFLYEFPLCYAYWKKYADHEKRRGNTEHSRAIYERGVAAVAYSPELWVHYATWSIEMEDPDDVRSLFERGLEYVGNDFLSGPLWRRYAAFERSQKRAESAVVNLYTRILNTPLKDLDQQIEDFRKWVHSKVAVETIPEEECAALREVVRQEITMRAAAKEAAAAEAAEAARDAAEEALEGGEGAEEAAAKAAQRAAEAAAAVHEPEPCEDEQLRLKFIGVRESIVARTKLEVDKVKPFEALIKRPYFHVKALDSAQRHNWHRYLDFEEKTGDEGRVIRMYERCLIPCASYPEFWIRYARRAEEGDVESARNVLRRAGGLFVKRRPEIHLYVAQFEERHGNVEAARTAFELVTTQLAPGLLEGITRHAHFERRQGGDEAACKAFDTAIEIEKAKEDSPTLSFLFLQYARFLEEGAAGDLDAVRKVYERAVRALPVNLSVWEAAIAFEVRQRGAGEEDRVRRVLSLVERASAPREDGDSKRSLPVEARALISARGVEFADMAAGPAEAERLGALHAARFQRGGAPGGGVKRAAPGAAPGSAEKKARPGEVAAGEVPAGDWSKAADAATQAQQAQWEQYYQQYTTYFAAYGGQTVT